MVNKRLVYIYLEEGEFLYDPDTYKVYTFLPPHKLVGHITTRFELITRTS